MGEERKTACIGFQEANAFRARGSINSGLVRAIGLLTGGRRAVLEAVSVAVLKEQRSFSPRAEDDFNSVFKGGGGT